MDLLVNFFDNFVQLFVKLVSNEQAREKNHQVREDQHKWGFHEGIDKWGLLIFVRIFEVKFELNLGRKNHIADVCLVHSVRGVIAVVLLSEILVEQVVRAGAERVNETLSYFVDLDVHYIWEPLLDYHVSGISGPRFQNPGL